jgi:hypothetical protein
MQSLVDEGGVTAGLARSNPELNPTISQIGRELYDKVQPILRRRVLGTSQDVGFVLRCARVTRDGGGRSHEG